LVEQSQFVFMICDEVLVVAEFNRELSWWRERFEDNSPMDD